MKFGHIGIHTKERILQVEIIQIQIISGGRRIMILVSGIKVKKINWRKNVARDIRRMTHSYYRPTPQMSLSVHNRVSIDQIHVISC